MSKIMPTPKDVIDVKLVGRMVDKIGDMIAGLPSEIQGAILSDLASLWICGHMVGRRPDGTLATYAECSEIRQQILDLHIQQIRHLMPVNHAIILDMCGAPADPTINIDDDGKLKVRQQ